MNSTIQVRKADGFHPPQAEVGRGGGLGAIGGGGGCLGGPNGDMGKRVQTGDVQVMTWGQGWGYSRVLVQRDELNFGQIEFKGCKPAGG